MSAPPIASVVIVNFNAADQLRGCLAALEADPDASRLEIIVVDNASSDDSAAMVRRLFPRVRLIVGEVNVGYARANNLGIAVARAPYVLLLNNDSQILPGAVAELIAFLAARPETGAVVAKLLNPDLTLQANTKGTPNFLSPFFGRRSLPARWFPRNPITRRYVAERVHDYTAPFEADIASSNGLLVRSSVLRAIGGFDPEFFCYWSDADLSFRIREAGWLVFCDPAAEIIHNEHQGGSRASTHRSAFSAIDFHYGAYLFYRKHRARHAWSPMRSIAAGGLALLGAFEIMGARWRSMTRRGRSAVFNPAESPEARTAIRRLRSAIALLTILLACAWLGTIGPVGSALRYVDPTPWQLQHSQWAAAHGSYYDFGTTVLDVYSSGAFPYPAPARYRRTASASPVTPIEPDVAPRRPELSPIHLSATGPQSHGFSAFLLDSDRARVDRKVEELKRSGATCVRMHFRWDQIEPTQGDWQLDAYDYAIDQLSANGIQVLGDLEFTPHWAALEHEDDPDDTQPCLRPADLNDFDTFVRTIVRRYEGRVSHWQIWNEPDLTYFWRPHPNPDEFAELLRVGAHAVKDEDPDATVVFPGVVTGRKLDFLERVLDSGAADEVDVFAYHDYTDAPEGTVREGITDFVNLIRRHRGGDAIVWCTELGWSTYTGEPEARGEGMIEPVDETTQGENLVKRMTILRGLPVEQVYIWELSDIRELPEDNLLARFGVLRSDLSTKPSYDNVRAMFPLLEGSAGEPGFPVTATGETEALELHSHLAQDGRLLLVAWTTDGADRTVSLRLGSFGWQDALGVDLDTLATAPIPWSRTADGIVLPGLAVGRRPVVVVMSRPDVYVEPESFSPDGDGVADSSDVVFSLAVPTDVRVRVLDGGGDPVRTVASILTLPAGIHRIPWDGLDDDGDVVPDGAYEVEVRIGGTLTSVRVTVDTGAPRIGDIVPGPLRMPSDVDRTYFYVPIAYELSEPSSVIVDVYDGDGRFYARLVPPGVRPAGRDITDWAVSILHHDEGWYWFTVTATDMAGSARSVAGEVPYHLDITPPSVHAGWTAPSFSPNADGVEDTNVLGYSISERSDVIAKVIDSDGTSHEVFLASHVASGTHEFVWDGRGWDAPTSSMRGLPNGDYLLSLEATDDNGNSATATATVRIDGADYSGPSLDLVSLSPTTIAYDAGSGTGTTRVRFRLGKTADVFVSAIARSGVEYAVAALLDKPAGSYSFVWDGTVRSSRGDSAARLPAGAYTIRIEATGLDGTVATRELPLTIAEGDREPPDVHAWVQGASTLSSDGDGGRAVIGYRIEEKADVLLYVLDGSGRRWDITGRAGLGPGAYTHPWDGRALEHGGSTWTALGPGRYDLCVEARDAAGNWRVYRTSIGIKGRSGALSVGPVRFRTLPRGIVERGRVRLLSVEYELSKRADVVMTLTDAGGREYRAFALPGVAPGRHDLVWDGMAYDPVRNTWGLLGDGMYEVGLEATDTNGRSVTWRGRSELDLMDAK